MTQNESFQPIKLLVVFINVGILEVIYKESFNMPDFSHSVSFIHRRFSIFKKPITLTSKFILIISVLPCGQNKFPCDFHVFCFTYEDNKSKRVFSLFFFYETNKAFFRNLHFTLFFFLLQITYKKGGQDIVTNKGSVCWDRLSFPSLGIGFERCTLLLSICFFFFTSLVFFPSKKKVGGD